MFTCFKICRLQFLSQLFTFILDITVFICKPWFFDNIRCEMNQTQNSNQALFDRLVVRVLRVYQKKGTSEQHVN